MKIPATANSGSPFEDGQQKPEHAVPEEQTGIQRLEEMKASGWEELRHMDLAEFDEFVASLRPDNINKGHPIYMLTEEAFMAACSERSRREGEKVMRRSEIQRRNVCISKASDMVRDALRECERAVAIEPPDVSPRVLRFIAPDEAVMMHEDDLRAAYDEACEALRRYVSTYGEQERHISQLKSSAAKKIAKELHECQAAQDKARVAAERVRDVVGAELRAREERRASEQRKREEVEKDLPGIVEELRARIAELEAK